MPAAVAVVTDSTACLPAAAVREHDITVVPLRVVVDGTAYDEGVPGHADGAAIAAALEHRRRVATSRPAPHAFAEVYQRLAERGAQAIVSIHLSGDMSGTAESAALAAREAAVPVHVVDSRSLGMGLGFAVLTAAERAAAGADPTEVAAAARDRARRAMEIFCLDTLEYLRRGGRIGAAQALLGSALAVKPLLRLQDGRVEPFEKVRTASRALTRLEDVAVDYARRSGGVVDVAVHHLAAADRAQRLAGRLRERLSALGALVVAEIGPVVGVHAGPGMVAVVVAPR